MATKNAAIREGRKIPFGDGKEREVFPVSIRNMRKMMKVMSGIDDNMDNLDSDTIDTLLEAVRIVLDSVDPKLVAASNKALEAKAEFLANGKEEEAENVEDPLEDVLDIKTMNEVLAAGMGTDPNF